mgnify:CR=1 FL=1
MTIEEFANEIKQIHDKNGTKLMCLQKAQTEFGYLSKEAMTAIANEFGTTTSEIYSIASFYAQFTFVKKGKYVINVCLGTACYVKGSAQILEKFEELFENEYENDFILYSKNPAILSKLFEIIVPHLVLI